MLFIFIKIYDPKLNLVTYYLNATMQINMLNLLIIVTYYYFVLYKLSVMLIKIINH